MSADHPHPEKRHTNDPGLPLDLDSTCFSVVSDLTDSANLSQDNETIDEPLPQKDRAHTMDPSTADSPDSLLTKVPANKYSVHGEIARGGMGIVLDARDNTLHRDVALKVMINPGHASRQRVLRFIAEARITSWLQHPGIMPIHELALDKNGNVFYTMKRVTGKTLKDALNELKAGNRQTELEFPLGRLLTILHRVCDAVAYAHDRGVVHRDLKPENIMIGDYGEVLVLDWGLAKCFAERRNMTLRTTGAQQQADPIRATPPDLRPPTSDLSLPDPDLLLTMEGHAIGTPGYMAPEQASGQVTRMDERSDIYSLGAILYHILTLEPTVQGSKSVNRQELLAQISAGRFDPPKETRRAAKPLIAITMKALSLRPMDRYSSVKKFQADLNAYTQGFATSAEDINLLKLVTLFILRHRTAALVSLMLISILSAALVVNFREKAKAARADQIALAEGWRATEALSNLRATAPTLISLADYHIKQQEMRKALEVVERATALVNESPDCHRKKGDILQTLQKFDDAAMEYQKVLELDPSDLNAASNLALSLQLARQPDIQTLSAALWQQKRFSEASHVMLPSIKQLKPDLIRALLQWLLENETIQYRHILVDDTSCSLDLSRGSIRYLFPLTVMPLTHLNLAGCTDVYDLRPLKDMPLKSLNLEGCTGISDLSAIRGMPLEQLNIAGHTSLKDLSLLNGMPLKELNIAGCENITDLRSLKGGMLTKLNINGCMNITSLAPLKGMPLLELRLHGCTGITSLLPLKGMPLSKLDISDCANITDLRPLQGMLLTEINLDGCTGVTDFSPLREMPFTRFTGGGFAPTSRSYSRKQVTSPTQHPSISQ